MDQYLIFQNGEQKGPFTLLQLRAMWSSGAITVQTLYWQEGQPDWLPLESMLNQLESSSLSPAGVTYPIQTATQMNVFSANEETTVWTGKPAHLNYVWSWLLGILLLPAGVGLLFIAGIFLVRARRRYTVTNLRVSVQTGLIVKSTNEVRIRDIRSINVTKKSVSGFLGVGNLELSSAASDKAEIIFEGISGPDRVRDAIRQIQG